MHLTLSSSLLLAALILGNIRIVATRAISEHGSILSRGQLLADEDHSGKSNIQQRWEVVGENSSLRPRVDITIPKIPDVDPSPEVPAKLPPEPEGEGGSDELGGPPTAEIPPEIPPAGSDPAPEETAPDPDFSDGPPSPTPYDPASEATFNPEYARGLQNPLPANVNSFKTALDYLTGKIPRDESLFYSGANPEPIILPNGEVDATLYHPAELYSDKNNMKMWDGLFKTSNIIKNPDWYDKACMSAAYARVSSGIVKVVLPDEGVSVRNTWTDFEWPELVNNPDVTQIIRVDPDGNDGIPIWMAGDPNSAWPLGKPVSQIRGSL